MVAKITHPATISKAIYYNENKVEEKAALFIYAANFIKDTDQLSKVEKRERFERLNALNQGIKLNTLHVSLNFDPSEKFADDKLIKIAGDYMERIGFGDQPYLVYKHTDAGHPHIHIVSNSIRADGSAIDMNFIGRDKSEPARKAIEEKYHLVKAEEQKKKVKIAISPLNVKKLQYGQSETKRGITNVLDYVLKQYKFTSLPELNAILRLYNLQADPGQPSSRVYQHRGLVYQMIDKKGKPSGVRIKASAIHSKPTLVMLEGLFSANKLRRQPDLKAIRSAIDSVIRNRPGSWRDFIKMARTEKIVVIPYVNAQNKLYGISFLDLGSRAIFIGSDMGKPYSAQSILERLTPDLSGQRMPHTNASGFPEQQPPDKQETPTLAQEALEILLQPENQNEKLPLELRKNQKKRRSQNL